MKQKYKDIYPPEEQQVYTITDYQKLHRYVLSYQAGDVEAADKIIESFRGFIWKFTNLISNTTFKVNDYSTRRFISLYVVQTYTRKYNSHYEYKPTVREQLEDTARRITSLFEQYSVDEIRNELVCILLTMAKKYKDTERPSFHNYVDKCFHFEAFRGLSHLISDPVTRLSYDELLDNVTMDLSAEQDFENSLEEVCHEMAVKNADIPVLKVEVSPFDTDSLNTNWVNGITCSELFKQLTPFERKIIVLHYIDGLTDTEIADQVGVCRATINRRRLRAKEKLSVAVKSDKETDESDLENIS